MAFDSEMDAFMAFAKAMPNNSVLLVDTYDTVEGVHKARFFRCAPDIKNLDSFFMSLDYMQNHGYFKRLSQLELIFKKFDLQAFGFFHNVRSEIQTGFAQSHGLWE